MISVKWCTFQSEQNNGSQSFCWRVNTEHTHIPHENITSFHRVIWIEMLSLSALQCVKRMNAATWTMLFVCEICPIEMTTESRGMNWITRTLITVHIVCRRRHTCLLQIPPDIISNERLAVTLFYVEPHWKLRCWQLFHTLYTSCTLCTGRGWMPLEKVHCRVQRRNNNYRMKCTQPLHFSFARLSNRIKCNDILS